MRKATPGEVVTFYSYKGGTGRTMSMVNLACLLADRIEFGERILLVDWDLEAPGLHRYFHDRLRPAFTRDNAGSTDSDATNHPGLIDLFACLREAGDSTALKRKRKPDVRAKALLDAVNLDDYILSTHLPNLDMIKAGRLDAGYGARVNSFPWEAFHKEYPLAFRELAERLKGRYRYVFIDSRTGQTDTAGICTTLMPEKLVLVFTPNRQSLYGIETVLKDAVAYRRRDQDSRPLVAYPLPSRVEVAQDDLRAKWRFGDSSRGLEGYEPFLAQAMKAAYGLSHCHLKRFFDEVQIKHSPVYAFGEEIAVLNEKTQRVEDDYSLTRAYQNLLAWLEPGYLPWESPEAIRLMRSLEKRAGAPQLETAALAEDLTALRTLAKRFGTEGDRGNAELVIRTGEAFARKYLGKRHAESLAYTGALVRLFTEQGKFGVARPIAEKLVVQSCQMLGDEQVDTLEYKSILATLLGKQGDFTAARALQESTLATQRRVLGGEHPDTLTSMNNLANTLYAQGDLAGALELHKSALATRRRVLGAEHPDTLSSMNNLASTLHAQGDLAGALELDKSALATRRRVLGEEHPNTLSSMNNLALTLQAQGDLAGALELQQSVLATLRRVLGEEHPDTLTSMSNLASTLKAQGDLAGALELQKSVLATLRRVQGEEHPHTLSSMNNLAETLRAQGDLAGALELHKSALATRRRVQGEEHPDTLTSMNNLASTLQAQGDLAGALELEKLALATRRRVLGEEHPDTLTSMGNLANTLYAQGDLAGALELQKSVLATQRRVLGEEHPNTVRYAFNLAFSLGEMGEKDAARKLMDEFSVRQSFGSGKRPV
jgi:cellulose biosynthesis protein BcsQ